MQGRARRGQQQANQPQQPLAAGLLQILPLVLLLLFSIGGSLFSTNDSGYEERVFSFGRNSEFRRELETASGVRLAGVGLMPGSRYHTMSRLTISIR